MRGRVRNKTNRKCYRPRENLSVENSICREEVKEETVVHMTTIAGSLFHSGIVVHRKEDRCRAVLLHGKAYPCAERSARVDRSEAGLESMC